MKTSLPRILFSFSLCLLTLSAFAAPPNPDNNKNAASDEVIELPKVTIVTTRELPPPEEWLHGQIDGFEVLSNASAKATNDFLKDFQKFRRAFQIAQPLKERIVVSSTLILCARKNQFSDFIPTEKKKDSSSTVSLLLHNLEQTAIIIDLEAKTIQSDIGLQVTPNESGDARTSISHHKALYREYVRFLLAQTDFPPPPWLLEGISQIVMDLDFTDRWINYGKIERENAAPRRSGARQATTEEETTEISIDSGIIVEDQPFDLALRNCALISMDKFFAVPADAPEARNPLGNSLWAKQAYAFVHMCMFKADKKFQQPLALFVKRLGSEPLSEELFKDCFKLSYRDMNKELGRYVRYPVHKYKTFELAKEDRLTVQDVPLREATQSEVGLIKGDAQRLAGRHVDALYTYRTAYARGERDPTLLAALGVEEFYAGENTRARKFLEAAAKLGANRPSAWNALARLRLDEAKAIGKGKLSPQQMATVFGPLMKARSLKPAIPETYRVMAEAWELSEITPTPANIHVLGEGAMRFPFETDLSLRTARLYARAGANNDALEVARLGLRFATNDATRSQFEIFLSTLPPPTPSPAAPGPSSPPSKTNSTQK